MNIEKTNDLPDSDPRHHAMNISKALKDLAAHAREDTSKVNDDRGPVLFETTAEVLLGLAKAHDDFAAGAEATMQGRAEMR
jgi:hypothetical protein